MAETLIWLAESSGGRLIDWLFVCWIVGSIDWLIDWLDVLKVIRREIIVVMLSETDDRKEGSSREHQQRWSGVWSSQWLRRRIGNVEPRREAALYGRGETGNFCLKSPSHIQHPGLRAEYRMPFMLFTGRHYQRGRQFWHFPASRPSRQEPASPCSHHSRTTVVRCVSPPPPQIHLMIQRNIHCSSSTVHNRHLLFSHTCLLFVEQNGFK